MTYGNENHSFSQLTETTFSSVSVLSSGKNIEFKPIYCDIKKALYYMAPPMLYKMKHWRRILNGSNVF